MKDFIFIAGAPGSGKSTVAEALQKKLDSPLFEFGWIPEFRNKGKESIGYQEEESLSFENLVLVAKNYAKHGFKNIIITDLNNDYIEKLPEIFNQYDYAIYTLRLEDESVLETRVMDETRSSGYRDWQKALEINRGLHNRQAFSGETFVDVGSRSVEAIVESVLTGIE